MTIKGSSTFNISYLFIYFIYQLAVKGIIMTQINKMGAF
ncbi:hypothetical protein LDG_6484 [Legionella drancourtii LLAP12]|uniref:Uncharacterized protein n=1 Tax=Legionella drancourtii LLAP12 TaxID=658187 RepID=G9EML6_9GAMM|nr:hypothetical protein LDG_6484 [Legionella drancourtii LLAP12]